MPSDGAFEYDFSVKLSKYNTLRYEDRTREKWQEEEVGEFVRNDRFFCKKKPKKVAITIRKTYEIWLEWARFFLCIPSIKLIEILCILPIDKTPAGVV